MRKYFWHSFIVSGDTAAPQSFLMALHVIRCSHFSMTHFLCKISFPEVNIQYSFPNFSEPFLLHFSCICFCFSGPVSLINLNWGFAFLCLNVPVLINLFPPWYFVLRWRPESLPQLVSFQRSQKFESWSFQSSHTGPTVHKNFKMEPKLPHFTCFPCPALMACWLFCCQVYHPPHLFLSILPAQTQRAHRYSVYLCGFSPPSCILRIFCHLVFFVTEILN